MPATKETCLKEEGQQFLRIIQISYIIVTYLWRDLRNFIVPLSAEGTALELFGRVVPTQTINQS